MTKVKKIFWIGIALITFGTALLVAGLVSGAVDDVEAITRQHDFPKGYYTDEKIDDFESLDIDVSNLYVLLVQSDDEDFHISYFQYGAAQTWPVTYEVVDHRLTIKDIEPKAPTVTVNTNPFKILRLLNGEPSQSFSPDAVKISIPKDKTIQDLILKANGDTFYTDNVIFQNITLDTKDHSFSINNSSIKQLTATSQSSSIDLDNTKLDKGQLEMSDGSWTSVSSEITQLDLKKSGGPILVKDTLFKADSTMQLSDVSLDLYDFADKLSSTTSFDIQATDSSIYLGEKLSTKVGQIL